MKAYDHKKIEKKWQKEWEKKKLYQVKDKVKDKKNYYTLVEFTYPSGNLHVGHWYAFGVTDIFARFKRMQGYNVLFPMGFDSFGLPAENAAINLGADPKVWTYKQMAKMRTQLHSMGAMFDWEREVVSSDPEYYKWTQWMFNQFLKRDLVYRAVTKVNWCPKDQTILANEQVIDGCCNRCGTVVEQRNQEQWMLRITRYADRLVDDLEKLAWPEEIKAAQRNWIGRSEGAEIEFKMSKGTFDIKVFTTRPDTIFGATYLVLAPEHNLISDFKSQITNWKEVEKYITDTEKRSELDRQQSKVKTGVELKGVKAINPATGEEIPVWIADYVLSGYGTGAIMAVPAHDERDFEFAKKYNLPVKQVIEAIFSKNDGEDEIRKELPMIRREAVVCVVKHWSQDKYLCLKWKKVQWSGFVTGGVDDEHPIDAGKREILEETGYKNVKFLKELGSKINVQFYHVLKGENRWAHFQGLYFELENGEQEEISEKEKDIHDIHWVDSEQVEKFLSVPDMNLLWCRVHGKEEAYSGEGILINSDKFSGMGSEEAKKEIIKFVGGKETNTYRLRDWGISRQRYWGTPIPIVYDPEGKAHAVADKHLPWLLPNDVDHKPSGVAPLAKSKELLKRTENIFGKGWKPEVETMDTFVDSSWYFYRYLDNKNKKTFSDVKHRDAWMPIDLYMGGAEHTTMHLLYSRFWVKALHDLGLVKEDEAYKVRRNRGLILGPDGQKMSKSRGNVIDPDEIVERLGTDTVRMYLAFMGPYGVTVNYPWDPNGVVGVRRFLERVWKIYQKIEDKIANQNSDADRVTGQIVQKTIKKVTEDMQEFKFNTSISAMMICLNKFEHDYAQGFAVSINNFKVFLQLLAPFAPHITEELWQIVNEKKPAPSRAKGSGAGSIHLSSWPLWDEKLIVDDEVKIAVQVNGKVRAELVVRVDAAPEEIKKNALADPNIVKHMEGKEPKKIIYIKNRLINIVV